MFRWYVSKRRLAGLRLVAKERIRQSKFKRGEIVFCGGLCYGMVELGRVSQFDKRPQRSVATVFGKHTAFFTSMTHIYRTKEEYEASGVHWGNAPWQKVKI